ncbi:uncharacterized protein C3orf22 homolog [Arvicola amphibius]|uniref:uncharacterized protein C3orf22 homolog n=1 Tax=Arvicola amphibius TaxID=1047088 RepID=UPI001C09EF35|nr:uncharacterized protein C3orf22 homolog [Arvicola amphibius]
MESRGLTKPLQCKRHKIKTQEKLIKKFPYRLSWLMEPSPDSPQSWKAKSKASLKDQLPLQKKLLPTRSIPLPGFGAPDFTSSPPFSCCSQPPHPPLCNLWELKLLHLRFPRQDLSKLAPQKASADQPYTSGDMLACEGTSVGSITVAASLEGMSVISSSVHSTEGGSVYLNASGCDTPGRVALELGVSFSKQAPSGALWKLS